MTDSPDKPQDTQPDEDSGVAPELESTLDPAQQSVADALRFTFVILKIVVAIVLLFWVGSNIYTVGSNETVVQLRLGAIHSDSSSETDTSKLHWAWPYPFGDIVRIPNTTQEIKLDSEFWINVAADRKAITIDEVERMHQGPLTPGLEGSLLTGDANLIHARWTVEYRVKDAPDYLKRVGSLVLAERIVRAASEQSIVFNIARLPADDLIRSQVGAEGGGSQLDIIRQDINVSLEDMATGLEVTKVLLRDPTLPMPVRRSYRESTAVISEQAQRVEQARQQASAQLSETAGEATDELYRMISDYQMAMDAGNEEEVTRLEKIIDDALFGRVGTGSGSNAADRVRLTGPEYGNRPISGKVAELLNEAETYRNSIASRINAEATTFEAYNKRIEEGGPAALALLRSQLWEAARTEILSNKNIETMYLPADGAKDIAISRDAKVRKEREQAALQEAERRANN